MDIFYLDFLKNISDYFLRAAEEKLLSQSVNAFKLLVHVPWLSLQVPIYFTLIAYEVTIMLGTSEHQVPGWKKTHKPKPKYLSQSDDWKTVFLF